MENINAFARKLNSNAKGNLEERRKTGKFNIFKLQDRHTSEVHSHSRFIAELLNPKSKKPPAGQAPAPLMQEENEMYLDSSTFYEQIDTFAKFPEKITDVTAEEFKKVFGCEMAGKSKDVVYVWRSERAIRRLKGESDILYIGQTKQSFRDRYFQYAGMHATSKANLLKFKHIIDVYGAITISVTPFSKYGESLQKAEGQLLWWYFQNHCEYPPINYTQTKIRNDVVAFS